MRWFQNNLTAVEHVKLEKSAADEQNLLYEQSDLRIEVVELTRLAAIKVSYRFTGSQALWFGDLVLHCFTLNFSDLSPFDCKKIKWNSTLEFFVSINWMKIL